MVLRIHCKGKNRERFNALFNKIVYEIEENGKTEDDFINPKERVVVDTKEVPVYVFLDPSEKHGGEFKSLLDCVIKKDIDGFNKHFRSNVYIEEPKRLCDNFKSIKT